MKIFQKITAYFVDLCDNQTAFLPKGFVMFKKFSLALLPFFVSIAHAERLPVNPDAKLKIGANVSFNQSAYHQDNQVVIMPQAFYDNNLVYIEGSEAGVYAYKDAKNEWRATLGYESRHFDPKESPVSQLQGLDKRQWSAMLGSSYMRITPYGGFKIQAETDILNRNDGTIVKLAHLSRFKLMDNKVTIYPELGLQWHNKAYNQYYYGVSQVESNRTGTPVYQADSSVHPYFQISGSYQIKPNLSIFANQYLEYLSDKQKQSPLVDDRLESRTKIGFNYQF